MRLASSGLPAAIDIFSFLVSLITYEDAQHGDELAGTGLSLAACRPAPCATALPFAR